MTVEFPAVDGSSPQRRKFGAEPPMCIDTSKRYSATIATTKGAMVAE